MERCSIACGWSSSLSLCIPRIACTQRYVHTPASPPPPLNLGSREICAFAFVFFIKPTILNQMDITTDGFGFMLAFGDLTHVPFTYGLQARYLAFHPVSLGPVRTAAIVGLELLGLWIFRDSNNEKGNFRAGRNPKSTSTPLPRVAMLRKGLIRSSACLDLTFMETESGSKLLTSGWWGLSRHPVRSPHFCDYPPADGCRIISAT